MRREAAIFVVMSFNMAGLASADAGDCLAIWVDARAQPAECRPVQMAAELDHQPDVCGAESEKKAAIRVRLTSCREQAAAMLPPPGTAVTAHEHVVQALVSEGKLTKELTGRDSRSWADAVGALCRAIVAWHGEHSR